MLAKSEILGRFWIAFWNLFEACLRLWLQKGVLETGAKKIPNKVGPKSRNWIKMGSKMGPRGLQKTTFLRYFFGTLFFLPPGDHFFYVFGTILGNFLMIFCYMLATIWDIFVAFCMCFDTILHISKRGQGRAQRGRRPDHSVDALHSRRLPLLEDSFFSSRFPFILARQFFFTSVFSCLF